MSIEFEICRRGLLSARKKKKSWVITKSYSSVLVVSKKYLKLFVKRNILILSYSWFLWRTHMKVVPSMENAEERGITQRKIAVICYGWTSKAAIKRN